jgi:hypothetical protein
VHTGEPAPPASLIQEAFRVFYFPFCGVRRTLRAMTSASTDLKETFPFTFPFPYTFTFTASSAFDFDPDFDPDPDFDFDLHPHLCNR